MLPRLPILALTVLLLAGCATAPDAADVPPTAPYHDAVVEASCGQCRLGLDGAGCDLAVRIDDRAYFVDGTSIDDHGDAHAADGLCNAVRRARVSGTIEGDRFVATSFELLADGND